MVQKLVKFLVHLIFNQKHPKFNCFSNEIKKYFQKNYNLSKFLTKISQNKIGLMDQIFGLLRKTQALLVVHSNLFLFLIFPLLILFHFDGTGIPVPFIPFK